MGWTYSDWQSQSTVTAKRTRLILYIQELEDAIKDRKLSANSDSKGYTLEQLTEMLREARADLRSLPGSTGGLSKIRLGRIC